MARAKRKRDNNNNHNNDDDDKRFADPYLLTTRPCRFADHHRRNAARGKNAGVLRNCSDNPNCLYGLGEYQAGVWQTPQLLQRVFGDDPRVRQRKWVNQTLQPVGLRNLGATCYLNSLLQCLFANLRLRNAVYEWEPRNEQRNQEQTLQMTALQNLFAQMQLGNESCYDPTEFTSTLLLNNVMQQDAQEFSKLLLTHLRTIFRQSKLPRQWDLVDQIFQGQMSYVTKCLNCKHKSMRPSSYYEISLNIKGHKSVEDCIRSYLAAEVLEGENKYFCEQCNTKQCAERFLELNPRALPATLMVQLMRFVYDANAGRKKKLTDAIEADVTLNLTELLRRNGQTEAFDESADVVYRLQGYLNHRGKSAHVGHYTASVAYPVERMHSDDSESVMEWFEFDDAVVSNMTKSETIKVHSHGAKICSRDIYMLVYVRDDPASTNCGRPSGTNEIPLPSKRCRNEVEVLNASFSAEVTEYVRKVSGMEARIQERLDAYKRFFEENEPFPGMSESSFYWVDTEWLRCWVTGEKLDHSVSMLSISPRNASNIEASSNQQVLNSSTSGKRGGKDSDNNECVIVDPSYVDAAPSGEKSDGECILYCPDTRKVSCARFHDDDVTFFGQTPLSYYSRLDSNDADAKARTARAGELRGDDIPFTEPIDVGSICCAHSCDVDLGARCHEKKPTSPVLRFAPENAHRLKRISANLYAYIKENGGVTPWSARGGHAHTRVFEAASYRCTICENEFKNKLSKHSGRLHRVDEELVLLKDIPPSATAAYAAGNAYLMSRAWLRSYKSHLQMLRKELTHAVLKNKRGKVPVHPELNVFYAAQRDGSVDGSSGSSGACDKTEVWRNPINKDITCLHGNLTLEKRSYRPVSAETWAHFSSKYPCHAVYDASTTDPCLQCQIDDMSSKKCIEVERGVRDEIMSITALESLFRRKTERGTIRLSDVFDKSDAQDCRGSEKASLSVQQGEKRLPRPMFLVSRSWLTQWRKYIRSVDETLPSKLTSSCPQCMHQKLVLSPGLLTAQEGQVVDVSSLDVEFVSMGEMQALAERYGAPAMPLYYGLLVATTVPESGEEASHVVWRKCSLASLQLDSERHVSSDGRLDGTMPLVSQEAMDNTVICAECQASSNERYRDELVNFINCVVNIQQLDDSQVVPTRENLTLDEKACGRRRSRRARPGSAWTRPITANATDTVYMLKAKIYAEIDALPMCQRLYYRGAALENCRTLKELGIKAGDAVFMRVSEDAADDLVVDDSQEREVGFVNSVFHSHPSIGSDASSISAACEDRALAMRGGHRTRVWVCPACTYVNDDTDIVCEICSATRNDKSDHHGK